MVWWKAKGILCLHLCVGAFGAAAQQPPKAAPTQQASKTPVQRPVHASVKPSAKPAVPVLLSADDGMAVLGAALEARPRGRITDDCSHLVHAIYEQAGFSYSYANSIQLYAGVPQFRQVERPQPGDLAVWLGHVAIVVNPAQHSFFGSTRTGLRVESYDSGYWKDRGQPHFLRYLKMPRSVPASKMAKNAPKPADARNVQPHRAVTFIGPKPVEKDTAGKDNDDAHPVDDAPGNAATLASAVQPVNIDFPRFQMVNAAQPKPAQVHAAILQAFGGMERALQNQDTLQVSQPLVAFDTFEVKKVTVKENLGWAEVAISGLYPLDAAQTTKPRKSTELERWPLTRRDTDQWELILPLKPIYLPRDLAVRVLTQRLVALTKIPGPVQGTEQKAQLAHLLNQLLEH